jgi:threonine/homoserine/homoserine lactone efflux protein
MSQGLERDKEEADRLKRIEAFHEQVILIVGFLGGVVFAGLVLVVGNPDFILNAKIVGFSGGTPSEYLQFASGFLAFLSGLCAITVMISLSALSQKFNSMRGRRLLWKYIDWTVGVILALFIGALLLIVWPVDEDWTTIPVFLVASIFALLVYELRKTRNLV